ncbi:hypothetical protein [Actinoplanes rectilineatus]|uniref:hypothetical protein n=1 Tax=Actinoplanes rectilineatus TaxID=113571 RepID=UPI0005F2AE84|nr:hypothetical protein [Actinoplanes rectilineatus]
MITHIVYIGTAPEVLSGNCYDLTIHPVTPVVVGVDDDNNDIIQYEPGADVVLNTELPVAVGNEPDEETGEEPVTRAIYEAEQLVQKAGYSLIDFGGTESVNDEGIWYAETNAFSAYLRFNG